MQVALNINHTQRNEIVDFFHLEKGKTSINLSGSNLINVLSEYEDYNQRMHKGYTNGSCRNKIYELENYAHANIMPWRVDEDFYMFFFAYCTSISKSLILPSTVELYCNQIRTALRWGMRHRAEVSDSFENFELPRVNRVKVALTMDEISQIYHFDFKLWNEAQPKGKRKRRDKIENFERVRDMFVLECLLGQRYSDMSRICPSWFDDTRTIMRVPCQQKTGNTAVVNIQDVSAHPRMALEILRKYEYYSPYKGNVNNANIRLHELLQIIGEPFSTRIIRSEYEVNNKIVIEEHPLWEVISTHTGRRTFVTLALQRNLSEHATRKASGHKDIRCFYKYFIDDDI